MNVSPADQLQSERRDRYASGLLLVLDDPEIANAAAAFDQAITNGLAAIVRYEWPGSDGGRRGIKSAAQLLGVIEQRATKLPDGTFQVSTAAGSVVVDVARLRRGISHTQPVRHARASKGAGIPQDILDAAAALDAHPALFALTGATIDESDRRARAADWQARQQAIAHWERLTDEERERRQEPGYVDDHLPFSMKDRLDTPDPQECDVCGSEAFLPESWDDFGGDHGPGICVACGYLKSAEIADAEAFVAKIEYEMGKPD